MQEQPSMWDIITGWWQALKIGDLTGLPVKIMEFLADLASFHTSNCRIWSQQLRSEPGKLPTANMFPNNFPSTLYTHKHYQWAVQWCYNMTVWNSQFQCPQEKHHLQHQSMPHPIWAASPWTSFALSPHRSGQGDLDSISALGVKQQRGRNRVHFSPYLVLHSRVAVLMLLMN